MVAGGEAGFQAVAQGHQFVDLGDDAVLFGEGGDGYRKRFKPCRLDAFCCKIPDRMFQMIFQRLHAAIVSISPYIR